METIIKKYILFLSLFIFGGNIQYCFAQTTQKNLQLREIELQYLNGKPCKISDFKGKYVLVDIWGQGCKPCVASIPELNKLHKKYKKKLVILTINDGIYFEKLLTFIKEKKIKYKVVIPKSWDKLMPICYTLSEGKFEGFPHYTLIDRAGKIIKNNTHYTEIESDIMY